LLLNSPFSRTLSRSSQRSDPWCSTFTFLYFTVLRCIVAASPSVEVFFDSTREWAKFVKASSFSCGFPEHPQISERLRSDRDVNSQLRGTSMAREKLKFLVFLSLLFCCELSTAVRSVADRLEQSCGMSVIASSVSTITRRVMSTSS